MLTGRSNRAIAASRGVSERTVANQVASVLAKSGCGSRSQLASAFERLGGER
jgi:DNA-binding NarL/FixJ family response regulator